MEKISEKTIFKILADISDQFKRNDDEGKDPYKNYEELIPKELVTYVQKNSY